MLPLQQEWKVEFADSFSYPTFTKTMDLKTLGFVHALEGCETLCGTLRYQTDMELDNCNVCLEIENVYETVEVFVNDMSTGVKLCKPYVFDLSTYIHKGINKLCIEVTNTLGTQVRDALSHYLPIEPFGMEGPITLKVEKSN